MILTEFDPERRAVINPQDFISPVENMPKVAVTCYSNATFERMVKELDARQIAKTDTANGTKPVYGAIYRGTPVALAMIDVGAAMSAAMLEDLFVMGVEKVVVFGTCGVLEKEIEDCSVIIPDCAVRDEGTSYHYAPPSDEIPVNEKHRELFENLLKELHVHYTVGKTWSTDAFYRETPGKVLHRKQQGCICVDINARQMRLWLSSGERNWFSFSTLPTIWTRKNGKPAVSPMNPDWKKKTGLPPSPWSWL